MNLHLVFPFVKWIFSKLGECIVDRHIGFVRSLRQDTGITLFAYTICTVFFISISTILTMLLGGYGERLWITQLVFWAALAAVIGYLVTIGLSIMFKSFKQDRAHLFETIKGSK